MYKFGEHGLDVECGDQDDEVWVDVGRVDEKLFCYLFVCCLLSKSGTCCMQLNM